MLIRSQDGKRITGVEGIEIVQYDNGFERVDIYVQDYYLGTYSNLKKGLKVMDQIVKAINWNSRLIGIPKNSKYNVFQMPQDEDVK